MLDQPGGYSWDDALPNTMLAWPLYGPGLENLGEQGRPVRWPVPQPGPGQILVRSDAVGLCYSDVKIIRLGSEHPRLFGRDLLHDPVVQGHEVSLTVVAVAPDLQHRFMPGQRLALQADIYFRGRNLAYGYTFRGGLAQYSILGPEIIEGDEGCYAIPVPAGLGYAEVALTEPWACVEAIYAPRRRLYIKPGGVLWIVGRGDDGERYSLGTTFARGWPGRIILTDVPAGLREEIERLSNGAVEVELRDGLSPDDYVAFARGETAAGFDDIIALDADARQVDRFTQVAATGATVALAGQRPLGREVTVDVGRIHYDYIVLLGTSGADLGAAYGPERNRSELRSGGVAWIVGSGGPMGRMHLQRMLEMPDGPRRIVAAETNAVRRADLIASFGPLAGEKGIELIVLDPGSLSQEALAAELRRAHGGRAHGGRGFDDIVVMVASVPAIESVMAHLAPDGMLVLFAGLARGTMAQLDISNVFLGNLQLIGSAGSTIHDQATVIQKVAAGHLSTVTAVAAIGGLDAARDGIQALMDGRYPGKVVIFPQVPAFPLTALADLAAAAPAVHARLSPEGAWTREAEDEFLRTHAKGYER